MKKKISVIITTLFSIVTLLTVMSCGGMNNLDVNTSQNPVLKIVLHQSARTIIPDSDFSTFAFTLKSGETLLGSYTSSSALESDVIDLKAKGINAGDEITLTLTAEKGEIKWEGSSTITVKASENRVEIPFFITALGSGNGSIAYTLDFSRAPGGNDVVAAHVIISPVSDTDVTPVLDEWYGFDAAGNAVTKTISDDSKILVEKSNIPAGNYRVKATFYAEGILNAKVLDWYENIAVAAGTVSRGTSNINTINRAYTVTFDLNYEGSTPFQKKVSYFTDINAFKPVRDGYVFKGWFTDEAFTNTFTGMNVMGAPGKDVTVYAKWDVFAPGAQTATVFNADTVYVTPENYTIGEIANADDSFWYKINTTPGAQYKITWLNYWSFSNGSYVYNGDLMSYNSGLGLCEISLYTKTAEKIVLKRTGGYDITGSTTSDNLIFFTAESSETFINISKYVNANTYGKYAFRVITYDPETEQNNSVSALVTVSYDDIGVLYRRTGDYGGIGCPEIAPFYWAFQISGSSSNYESYKWYVNDKVVCDQWCFNFKDAEYPLGIYTVTLEAIKKADGKLYSYTAQVEIIGSDKREGGN